jgi:type IV pilus assembly protein PilM
MKITKTPNFFHDKPLFGLDIGHGSLKVMQASKPVANPPVKDQHLRIVGYGTTKFDESAQKEGVIIKPEVIAKAAYDLFNNQLIGDITTRRCSIAIPAYRSFTRALQLPPKLPASELRAAVELEAEQYIPLPLEDLYLDYEIVKETADATDLFLTAMSKTIVDSYMELAAIMGLEAILIEPTLSSSGRLFSLDSNSDSAAFIIDFGSESSDISIYAAHTLVTGTVPGGGLNFTSAIKNQLGVSQEEAGMIKTNYGLGVSKRQPEIKKALEPVLAQIVKEIRRVLRYYEERYGTDKPVEQVITLGGGANMPGLSEYLTEHLRLAARHIDPWQYFDFKGLQPPAAADKPMFTTAAGLCLANPHEVFNHD